MSRETVSPRIVYTLHNGVIRSQIDQSQYVFTNNKHSSTLHATIACACGLNVKITKEGYFVRILKRLHALEEVEIGEEDFDEKVYILGDEPLIGKLIQKHPSLKKLLLWCCENTVAVTFKRKIIKLDFANCSLHETDRLLDVMEKLLYSAISDLNADPEFSKKSDNFLHQTWTLILAASLLFTVFITVTAGIHFSEVDGQYFLFDLFIFGFPVAIANAVWAGFVWIKIRGPTSYMHIQLSWIFMVVFFSSWILSSQGLSYLNKKLDPYQGDVIKTNLERKYIINGKGGPSYLFTFCFSTQQSPIFTRRKICFREGVKAEKFHFFAPGVVGPHVRVFPGYFERRWFRYENPDEINDYGIVK